MVAEESKIAHRTGPAQQAIRADAAVRPQDRRDFKGGISLNALLL
jgi:hypothetical protein